MEDFVNPISILPAAHKHQPSHTTDETILTTRNVSTEIGNKHKM